MEVHFKLDVQAKLEQMARESGRPSNELVEDALIGYFAEGALARVRHLSRMTGYALPGRPGPALSRSA